MPKLFPKLASLLLLATVSTFAFAESAGPASETQLFHRLTQLVTQANQSVVKTLDDHPAGAAREGLILHTVGVGLMTTWTVGLGPIVQVSAQPEIRLFYTKEEEPVFP
ncbi:MAG: hypothetical protein ACXVB9_22355 [Bdellovibrionota bacterium]